MKASFVLDAWALLALLQQEEPAASRVRQLIESAYEDEIMLFVSIINLGEVVYRVGKVKGEEDAWETYAQIQQLPLTILSVTDEVVLAAVGYKIRHSISYADAFAAVTSQRQQAILLTGDPELVRLQGIIRLEQLVRAH
ncbi:MAG: type II toxin-antitoxin system VapC family toxin [Ardenticatenaceae bacterium]|nr:type II toxin-antitoxin system VapC family toxin [Anaerolineales bacterium]MCB8917736.1 type II toxin-antitoxin system VapC family toxin [Ardenticatenaceae bacterium]